jgi:hypothetical protein
MDDKEKFINRIINSILKPIEERHKENIYSEIFEVVCYDLGLNANDLIAEENKFNLGGVFTHIPSLSDIANGDFNTVLEIIESIYAYFNFSPEIQSEISSKVFSALELAKDALGIKWKNGSFIRESTSNAIKEEISFIVNNERNKFIERVASKIFEEIQRRPNYKELLSEACFYLGINLKSKIKKRFTGLGTNTYYPHLVDLVKSNFVEAVKLIIFLLEYFEDDKTTKDKILQYLDLSLSLSPIDIGIKLKDFKLLFSGSDEVINIKNINNLDRIQDITIDEFSRKANEKPLRLHIDDIFSFAQVKNIKVSDIKDLLPISLLEDEIQKHFEDIIAEPDHKKDWGGEINDLYTSRLQIIEGKRVTAAFALKGRGTPGRLRIKNCGKNGDQLLRLFESPAILFVIQHIGVITEEVIKDVEGKTALLRYKGIEAYYCIIDGHDTVRILKAYNKL